MRLATCDPDGKRAHLSQVRNEERKQRGTGNGRVHS